MKGLNNSTMVSINDREPTRAIIEQLADISNRYRLADCHCHGPTCEGATEESGGMDKWDRKAGWSRAVTEAIARLQRLAVRWGDSGGAERQPTLPGIGWDGGETLAPPPGGRTQRDPARRPGNVQGPAKRWGRSRQSVSGDRG